MAKNEINEAEKYLLQNWRQARLVEKTMGEIREKYTEVYNLVWDALKASNDELDFCEIRVTQFWCEGHMGIGRKRWHESSDERPGIYIENLRLELLLDDDEEKPFVGIWTGKPKHPATDIEGVKKMLLGAEKLLAKDEYARCTKKEPSNFNYALWYELPETRQELAKMLFEGNGQSFAECLVSHFEVFLKLVPVLNDIFGKPVKVGS